MPMTSFEFSCLFYQEGNSWIAQTLEYDITAQAPSLPEAYKRLALKIVGEMVISMDLERELFHKIGPAPDQYWRAFEESHMGITAETPPLRIEDDGAVLPQFSPKMRIAEGPVALEAA